jgi:hypothetical protein
MSNELEAYIEDELAKGVSRLDIKNNLIINGGWKPEVIDSYFESKEAINTTQSQEVPITVVQQSADGLDQAPQNEQTIIELPKWVKILFRLYAVPLLIVSTLFGIKLVLDFTTGSKEFFPNMDLASGVQIALLVFVLVFLILEVIYGVGVYKFKRWVLPLVLTFSFSTVLIGLLTLVNQNFADIIELVGLLIGILFAGILGYVSIKYWNVFTGSARKLLIQIPLFLVLLPLILFGTLSQIFTDDKQINDSDLVLHPVEVLAEFDNAHYSLPNIDSLSSQEKLGYEEALAYARELDGKNLNNPEAIRLVNQTKSLTDNYIIASGKKGYQCPTLVNDYRLEAILCSLNDIRSLASLTAFRADVEADTGNSDQAIMTAVSVVQLGDLISNAEQPVIIEYLVGVAIMTIGLESIERTLSTSASTSDQVILSAISNLEQSKIENDAFSNSLRREYMGLKDASKSFEQFDSYFYQHNKTINQRAEVIRRTVAISSQGCDADTSQEVQEADRLVTEISSEAMKWPIISPNFIGKLLNSIVVASLNGAGQKSCEVNELNQSVQEKLKSRLISEPAS